MADPTWIGLERFNALLSTKARGVAEASVEKAERLAVDSPTQRLRAEYEALAAKRLAESRRSMGELVDDTGLSLARGVGNLALNTAITLKDSLGMLPAGNTDGLQELARSGALGESAQTAVGLQSAMTTAAGSLASRGMNQAITDEQSMVSQANKALVQGEIAEATAANERQRNEEVAQNRNALLADFRKFGRNVGDSAGAVLGNPTALYDGVVEQLPNLAAMSLAARGSVSPAQVQARASSLASRMGGEQGITDELLKAAEGTLQRRALVTSTTMMESSGAHVEGVNEVMGLSDEELYARYPEAAQAIAAGEDPLQVRAELAQEAGGRSAAIMAPIAAVAARLTPGFELSPTSLGGGRIASQAVQAVVRPLGEMGEELVQSGGSALSNNLAQMSLGGQGIEAIDDVAQQAGQGAALGLGTSLTMQSPTVTALPLQAGWKAAKFSVGQAIQPLRARAAAIKSKREADVQADKTRASQAFSDTSTAVSDVLQTSESPTASGLMEPVEDDVTLTPRARQALLEGDSAPRDRVQALDRAMRALDQISAMPEAERPSDTDVETMMLFAMRTARQLRTHARDEIGKAIQEEQDPAQLESLEAYRTQVESLANSEQITNLEQMWTAVPPKLVQQAMDAITQTPDFDAYIQGREGQRDVQMVIEAALSAPDLVSSEAAEKLQRAPLFQRLPEDQKKLVITAGQTAKLREEHAERRKALSPNGKTIDIVHAEIAQTGMDPKRRGLAQYQRQIMTALERGDLGGAVRQARALQHFARHFQNKSAGFNEALAESQANNGAQVTPKYRMVEDTGNETDAKANWVKAGFSDNLIEQINNDAQLVTETYNQIIAAHPELGEQAIAQNAPLAKSVKLSARPKPSTPRKETIDAPAATGPADAAPADDAPTAGKATAVAPPKAPVEERPSKEAATGSKPKAVEQSADEGPADNAVADEEAARQKELADAMAAFEKAKSEVVAEPEEDTRSLDDALDMSEADYIKAVNPEGKKLTQEDLDQLTESGAIDLPETAEKSGTITDKNGVVLDIYRDIEGDRYVVEEGTVVGTIYRDGKSTLNRVIKAAQGRQIGQAMMVDYLREFPFTPSGGFSTAGELARKRALEVLRAERNAAIEAARPTMAKRFPNLALQENNRFLEGFKLSSKTSALFNRIEGGLNGMVATFKDALDSKKLTRLQSLFAPQHQSVALDTEQANALHDVLAGFVPRLVRQVNTNLQKAATGERWNMTKQAWVQRKSRTPDKKLVDNPGFLAELVDGTADGTYAGNLLRNVLEVTTGEDGKPQVSMTQEVAQAGALAGANWILSHMDTVNDIDEDKLRDEFGDALNEELRTAFKQMHHFEQVTRNIGQEAMRILGLSANAAMSVTVTDALPNALGMEILQGLRALGTIDLKQVSGAPLLDKEGLQQVDREGNPLFKQVTFVDVNRTKRPEDKSTRRLSNRERWAEQEKQGQEPDGKLLLDGVKDQLQRIGVLGMLLTPDTLTYPSFGAPAPNNQTLARGTNQLLSKEQKDQIRKEDAVPYWFNEPLAKFVSIMGDYFLPMLGEQPVDELMHPEHAKSVDGVNSGLQFAVERMREIESMWYEVGTDKPAHFKHYAISNGRVMQDGFGPKSNKHARELMSANKDTLDLSDEYSRNSVAYFLSLAQALDMKLEKKLIPVTVVNIKQALASGPLADLVTQMQELMASGDETAAESFMSRVQELQRTGKFPAGNAAARALHAISTHARYLQTEDKSAFTTYLAVEIDGKTNGPFNALWHYGLWSVNAQIIRQLEKGGLIFKKGVMTLNELNKRADDRLGDLYQDAADAYRELLVEESKRVSGNDQLSLAAGVRLMRLAGYIDVSGKVSRQVAKDALTPSVYGSGTRGIVMVQARAITAALYEEMSRIAQTDGETAKVPDDIRQALQILVGQRFDRRTRMWQPTRRLDYSSILKLKLLPEHIEALGDGLQGGQRELGSEDPVPLGAGGLLVEGVIDVHMAQVKNTFNLMFAASALQMAVYRQAYTDAYEILRQKRIAAGELPSHWALSRKDERELADSLRHLAPVYALPMTGDSMQGQGVFAGARDSGGQFTANGTEQFTGPLSGGMSMSIGIQQYRMPGVKSAALTTQGGGDASMMNILMRGNSVGTMNVYDGWEVKISELFSRGLEANEAVLKTLEYDLLGSIEKSFDRLTEERFTEAVFRMGEDQLTELRRALKVGKEEAVYNAFASTKKRLREQAEAIRTNQKLLLAEELSVDQMSGPMTPATRNLREEFRGLPSLNGIEVAAARNLAASETEEQRIAREKRQTPSLVKQLGLDGESIPELVEMDADVLRLTMANYTFSSRMAKFVYGQIKHLIPSDLQVFVGSPAAVAAKHAELFPEQAGQTRDAIAFAQNNAVFLTAASEESLVHELVHVTTLHLMDRYYAGAKGLTFAQKDAIRELEKLADAFLKIDPESLPKHRRESLKAAQFEMRRNPDSAVRLNEFMAWTLSNENLAGSLARTEAPTGLKKLAKSIKALVRKLIGLPNNVEIDSFLDQVASQFHRLARRPRITPKWSDVVLFQRMPGDSSDRLNALVDQFDALFRMLPEMKRNPNAAAQQRAALERAATQAQVELKRAGFDLSDKEALAFNTIHAVMSSNMQLDSATVSAFDELLSQVIKQLKVEQLMDTPLIDDPADKAVAAKRLDMLTGLTNTDLDFEGRSTTLANFVALAAVHPKVREALANLVPVKQEQANETLDDKLRAGMTKSFNWAADRASGVSGKQTQIEVMDQLVTRLVSLQNEAARDAQYRENWIDKAEAYTVNSLEAGSEALGRLQARLPKSRLGKAMDKGLTFGRAMLLPGQQKGALAEAALQTANQMDLWAPLRSLISDWIGNTPSTEQLHQFVNVTKFAVARARQHFREKAPDLVRAFFDKPVSQATWAQMVKTVGQTDLRALMGNYAMPRIAELVTDSRARGLEIAGLEAQLGNQRVQLMREGQNLAQYMVTKDGAPRFSNAYAMAKITLGVTTAANKDVKALTGVLDRLVTLYAVDLLDTSEQQNLGRLMKDDSVGMEKLLTEMLNLVVAEENKPGSEVQRLNRWKGYVPASRDPRSQVVLASAEQGKTLLKQGFRRYAPYMQDSLDPSKDLAYYVIEKVGGQSTYTQGALQTVEGTMSGVDTLGRSLDPGLGTLVTSERLVYSIANASARVPNQKRLLRPVYNALGEVTGYERLLDPEVVNQFTRKTEDLAESIGVWLGRQAEETVAERFNASIIDMLAKRWNDDRIDDREDEYIDISKSKDPIIQDSWKAIPMETQKAMRIAFNGPVMIRKEMIDNSIGYRQASVADVFTGLNGINENTREFIINTAEGLLGENAYRKLLQAERLLQAGVGTAKDVIIVRSGVVALANAVANIFQLVAMGVPLIKIPKMLARTAQETELYLRNEKQLAELVIKLRATNSSSERQKLEVMIKRIQDANTRLSIWPLIQNGELPTISEGLSEQDEFTLAGDFTKWLETKLEGAPSGLATAFKVATISKDTAIYQGLNRFIQLGDFTAKKALYDTLLQRGMSKEQALSEVSEAFVNYNRNAGRARDMLERNGVIWFWNYKMRIQKIVLKTLREHPLRFLMSVAGAGLAGADSLMSSAAPMANWDYSIGPGQLFSAHETMLWSQIPN